MSTALTEKEMWAQGDGDVKRLVFPSDCERWDDGHR